MAVGACALVGCGKKGQEAPPVPSVDELMAVESQPAPTPKEAVMRWARALYQGDSAESMRYVGGPPAQRRAMAAMARFAHAASDFRDRFIDVYGREAWRRFNGPDGPSQSDATITLEDPGHLQDMRIEVRGDRATARKGHEDPLHLMKVENGWLVLPMDLTTSGQAIPGKAAAQMNAMADAIQRHYKAIDHGDITPEDIDVELGREFIRELLGIISDADSRYDVDDL
jgi:hypothetical protein